MLPGILVEFPGYLRHSQISPLASRSGLVTKKSIYGGIQQAVWPFDDFSAWLGIVIGSKAEAGSLGARFRMMRYLKPSSSMPSRRARASRYTRIAPAL